MQRYIDRRQANRGHREKDDHARVAVLFSGGIDSTVIAYLAHR